MPAKLSPTMIAVLKRLELGNGEIVPLQGGYWLPGEVAYKMPKDGSQWYEASRKEFNVNVGTQTIDSLKARGMLKQGVRGIDKRAVGYCLYVHSLTDLARDFLSSLPRGS